VKRLKSGSAKLTSNTGELGYLPSLLETFQIPVDSQALVFSKTSIQAPKLSPTNRRQNLITLAGRFDPGSYLSPVSDIVALMTFEHQTQMINFTTHVGREAVLSSMMRKPPK